jgi:hypothetical protein
MQSHYRNISLLRLDITRDAFLVFLSTIRRIKGHELKIDFSVSQLEYQYTIIASMSILYHNVNP